MNARKARGDQDRIRAVHEASVQGLLAEHPDWPVADLAPSYSEDRPDEPAVYEVSLWLCELCLGGAGGQCHSPGCALFLNRAPDVPVTMDSTGSLIRMQPKPVPAVDRD